MMRLRLPVRFAHCPYDMSDASAAGRDSCAATIMAPAVLSQTTRRDRDHRKNHRDANFACRVGVKEIAIMYTSLTA